MYQVQGSTTAQCLRVSVNHDYCHVEGLENWVRQSRMIIIMISKSLILEILETRNLKILNFWKMFTCWQILTHISNSSNFQANSLYVLQYLLLNKHTGNKHYKILKINISMCFNDSQDFGYISLCLVYNIFYVAEVIF